jgi:uncharacterized protein YkwD
MAEEGGDPWSRTTKTGAGMRSRRALVGLTVAGIVLSGGGVAAAAGCFNGGAPGAATRQVQSRGSEAEPRPTTSATRRSATERSMSRRAHRPWRDHRTHRRTTSTARPTTTGRARPTTQPTRPTATARPSRTATPRPTATAPRPTAPRPTAPAATPATGNAAEVLRITNAERAKAGCSALTVNAQLTTAAQRHTDWQAANDTMSHTGAGGSNPGSRITAAGYRWRSYGENVAYGYSTPAAVMTGWMNSPGHRANILNCSFKEIGIGVARGGRGLYWTQDFGTA